MLKRDNQSEKHLVLGSLEVLGKINGPGVVEVRRKIDSLANAQSTAQAQLNDYWTKIASDSIVSPAEKKTLKKEWQQIEQVYAAIKTEVEGTFLESIDEWKNYKKSYEDLNNYLFNVLKIFDNMNSDTTLPDAQEFLDYYNDYYSKQQLMQNAIINGKVDEVEDKIDEITENIPPYMGHYRGVYYTWDKLIADAESQELRVEDWIMWGGANYTANFLIAGSTYFSVLFTKSRLYQLFKSSKGYYFNELSPGYTDDEGNLVYSAQFMSALTDILKSQNAGPGYFSTVFANAFFANAASITALQTKTLTLQADGGMFKTSDYTAGGPHGFRMMSDAWASTQGIEFPIEFFGNTHLGGNVKIDGKSEIIGDALFGGQIRSGPLELLNATTEGAEYTYPAGSTLPFAATDVQGSYLGISFFAFTHQYIPQIVAGGQFLRWTTRLILYDNNMQEVWHDDTESEFERIPEYRTKATFYYKFNTTTNDKTFRLYNLPRNEPAVVGTVWNDNGTLKIKT